MGAVFEAENIRIDRRVAVKILRDKYTDRDDVVHRFMQEAKAAGMIGHAGICQVFDLGELDDGSPFLVMELMRGLPFAKALEVQGALQPEVVACVLSDVLAALAAAHTKGIVHRDLKPDNIFLAKHDVTGVICKLLDFGISKFTQAGAVGLTQTGTVMGTPLYMSPEQALGLKEIDHRVDIYACGVIGYEALTGSVPWRADNYNALMQQILSARYSPIRELRPDVPPVLAEIVARAMDREPKRRFGSSEEMAAELRAYLPDEGLAQARAQIAAFLARTPSLVPPQPADAPVPSLGADSGIRPSAVNTTPHGGRKRALDAIGDAATAMSPASGYRLEGLVATPSPLIDRSAPRPAVSGSEPFGDGRRPSGAERRPSGGERRASGAMTYRPFDVDADRWRTETQTGGSASSLRTPLVALGAVLVVGGIALAIAGFATGMFSRGPATPEVDLAAPTPPSAPLATPDPGTDLVAPRPATVPAPAPAAATPGAAATAAAASEGLLARPLSGEATPDAGPSTDRRRRSGAPPAATKRTVEARPATTPPTRQPRTGIVTQYPD